MQHRPDKIIFAVFMIFAAFLTVAAQDGPKTTTLSELKSSSPPATPTTAEVMRDRIATAKAYLVVKNYPAAVYELENIRRETNDPTVNRVLNVLLMHAYLEQGDYQKAQAFLKELHKNPAKALDYFAVAGQVISGARTQLARYKALGVSVSDTTLPDEAKEDLDQMRETLELVATQSELIGKRKEMAGTAFAVLEETSAARGNLARDAYDERRWRDQVSEAREKIVTPRSNIIDAVESPIVTRSQTPDVTLVAQTVEEEDSAPAPVQLEAEKSKAESAQLKPVVDEKTVAATDKPVGSVTRPAKKEPVPADPKPDKVLPTDRKVRVITSAERKPTDEKPARDRDQPNVRSTDQVAEKKPSENIASSSVDDDSPVSMGSLIGYATKRVNPVYPRQARTMRMQGTVKVEVIIDEDGNVSKVENTSGPTLLKRAASDAIRKWQFTPFTIDGQPVKATGFVSFNFNL